MTKRTANRKGMKPNGRGQHYPRGFAGIPRIVLDTDDFRQLPATAKVVLFALAYQYQGNNNGDLTAAHSVIKRWGIASKTTLGNAVETLLKADLIVRTREGRFLNPGGQCALYALTWQPIDECNGKLDVAATRRPPRAFSLEKIKEEK